MRRTSSAFKQTSTSAASSDEIPEVQKSLLFDIFENRSGALTPLLQRQIARDSRLWVIAADAQTILSPSKDDCDLYGLNMSDVKNRTVETVFDSEWRNHVAVRTIEEMIYLEYERDITSRLGPGPHRTFRQRKECYRVNLEDHHRVFLIRSKMISRPTGQDYQQLGLVRAA